MRSAHADKFNHDDEADGYDADVRNESDPIRAGYDEVLDWVAQSVPTGADIVVDLGCGTGNLALRLAPPKRLIGVDVSAKMLAIARRKLAGVPCELVQADLLECFAELPTADAIVSTYAVHHLTFEEKVLLFEEVHQKLKNDGIACFGDLMFESRDAEKALCAGYSSSGREELVADLRDEFFWHVDEAIGELERIGFSTVHRRFSELSWAIAARKRGG